jgi:hypothetical protein
MPPDMFRRPIEHLYEAKRLALVAAVSQPSLGAIADHWGLPAAYVVLAASVSLLMMFIFWKSRQHFPLSAGVSLVERANPGAFRRGCQTAWDSEIQRGTRSRSLSAPNSWHNAFKRWCAPRHSSSAIRSCRGTSCRSVAKRRYSSTSS